MTFPVAKRQRQEKKVFVVKPYHLQPLQGSRSMSKLLQVKCSTVLVSLCLVAGSLLAQAPTQQPQTQQPQVQQPQVQQPQAQQPQAQQPQVQQPPMQQQQTQYPPAQQYAPVPPQAPQVSSQNDFLKGKIDGEQEGKSVSTGIWMLVGCVSPLWAYVMEPEPPSSAALMGKSMEYIQGFNEGYKKVVKGNRTKNAWIGCIAGWLGCCLIYLIIDLIAYSSASSTS
jgi:hypothetical protein